jgi:DNA-binding XRE family transcriptional regulator
MGGSSETSRPEETEMPDDNERASEQDEFSSPVVTPDAAALASSGVITRAFEGEPSTNESANDSNVIAPANDAATAEPSEPRPRRTIKKPRARSRSGIEPNNVRKLRQEAMMSKAELARRAGVSPLTIDRVEAGCPCRMDTKRKILEALGLKPSARTEVWPDIDAQS